MRIAYCIFGFAREIYTAETIKNSLSKALPKGVEIDVYWSCPTQLDPDNPNVFVNQDDLKAGFQSELFTQVTINFFEYTPSKFYSDFITNSMPSYYLSQDTFSIFRIMSIAYNISNSVKLAYQSGNNYDLVIVTRNDYIPYILTYGIKDTIKKGVYALRTCPYRTNSSQVNYGGNFLDTEDRAFYGTQEEMFTLVNIYEKLPHILTSIGIPIYIELVLTEFFRYSIPDENIYYQDDAEITFPPKLTDARYHKFNSNDAHIINEYLSTNRFALS